MESDRRLEGHALVGADDGTFSLRRVLTRTMDDTDIAIRTSWSGTSIGTEFGALSGKIDYGPKPMTTGYMSTGVVTEVGAAVRGYAVGDRVYFSGNRELVDIDSGAKITCASGGHSSRAVANVETSVVGHVPDNVDDSVASMFVLPAVGLLGVNMAGVTADSMVVVYGVGQVGLAVVSAAAARGARVVAVDRRSGPLRTALEIGAKEVLRSDETDIDDEIEQRTGGRGADFVFEATGIPALLDTAIHLTRTEGTFVWQGNYGNGQRSFNFYRAHTRRLNMVFPCGFGGKPYIEAVMRQLSAGWLNWGPTVTDRIQSSEAPDYYEAILSKGAGDILGMTIRWPEPE